MSEPGPNQDLARSSQQGHEELQQELATWMGSDGLLAPPRGVGLRSLESKARVMIKFVNNSGVQAEIKWLTFCGQEQAYLSLKPGEDSVMYTFKTHPWIARAETSTKPGARLMLGDRMVGFPEVEGQCFTISQPPLLQWSLRMHKHFPQPFRDVAKAILLSHHSLSKQVAAPEDTASDLDEACSTRSTGSSAFSFFYSLVASMYEEEAGPQPICPRSFRSLPVDVLIHIISFMAPPQRQCITLLPDGHPDIAPALLPYEPATSLAGPCFSCQKIHHPF